MQIQPRWILPPLNFAGYTHHETDLSLFVARRFLQPSLLWVRTSDRNLLLSMKDDTVKVQQLSSYAKKVVHKDRELSRKASAAVLQISQKLNYPKGIATGYSYLAFIELQAGHHASATDLYDKAIVFYKRANDEKEVWGGTSWKHGRSVRILRTR